MSREDWRIILLVRRFKTGKLATISEMPILKFVFRNDQREIMLVMIKISNITNSKHWWMGSFLNSTIEMVKNPHTHTNTVHNM